MNRILRLYIGVVKPTENLKKTGDIYHESLCTDVVCYQVLALMPIRCCKAIFEIIKKTRYVAKDLRVIVVTVIQRNSYYACHENIILTMITDERKAIRELGFRRNLKARSKQTEKTAVRRFCVPKLNFDANEFHKLVEWRTIDLTEPPATKSVKIEELQDMIASKNLQQLPGP